jgi:hypothetical protein
MDLDRRDGAGDPYDPFYKVNVSWSVSQTNLI